MGEFLASIYIVYSVASTPITVYALCRFCYCSRLRAMREMSCMYVHVICLKLLCFKHKHVHLSVIK